MFLAILSTIIIIIVVDYVYKRKINKIFQYIPGPPHIPILGALWLHLSTKPDGKNNWWLH